MSIYLFRTNLFIGQINEYLVYDLILAEIQLQNLVFKTVRALTMYFFKSPFGMDVKAIVLVQLLNKSKLRNRTKTFLELIC